MAPVILMVAARRALIGLMLLVPPAAAKPAKPQAVAPAPSAVTPSVRTGVDLWRAGDFPAAVAIWQPFAAAGDADAMFNMGQAYKLGRAVPIDKALARDWYRKAAMKNHLPAQANLGILLFQAGEKPEAARWLKQAADRGEMRAQYVLGVAHWNGDGVPRSLPMAYAYLTRASVQGLTEATGALSNLSRTLSPADRASGTAIAASLGAGTGVGALAAASSPAGSGVMAADLNRRGPDAVQKPAPRPVETAQAGPVSPPTVPPAGLAVRTIDLPATGKETGVAQSAEAPRPVEKPVEKPIEKPIEKMAAKPGDINQSPSGEPVKLANKSKAAEKTKVTEKAKAAEPPAPGWRVQLGAYGSRAQAETAWAEISKKQKTAIAKAKPIFDPGRAIVKLQLGPYKARAEAKDACAKLAFAGQACFVTEG